jgi:hypothetical protein
VLFEPRSGNSSDKSSRRRDPHVDDYDSVLRTVFEITSMFNGKPKAVAYCMSFRNRNADAFGLPLNDRYQIGKKFPTRC